ncbi:MAG TPA: hypothetical protein VLB85_02345 [Acidimicrobiia bacterium]|nr:hypothetical protein [Acidimicrobiia bacterium]
MRFPILLLAVALLLAACDGGSDIDPTEPPPETTTITSPTSTMGTSPSTTPQRSTSTTTSIPTTTAPEEASLQPAVRCDSPEGYAISYPEGWNANSGDVVAECGQFHPEQFEVPDGSDERVAAVTAYVDPVPFREVAAPDDTRDAERAVTAVDGLQAVRLEYETGSDGLWPEGTPITLYAIDVGTESEERTLLVDTVGLSGFDYERNQEVLDRMIRSLDVDMDGVDDDPYVVARYEGGGGGFSVEGAVSGEQACLRIPPEGEEVCTDVPAPDQLHTVQLENLEPVLAGVTGDKVHAVTAERRDGTDFTALPAAIDDTDVRGFSFTFDLDEIERLVLTDVKGIEMRVIEPGG